MLVGPSKQLKQIFQIEHNIVKNPSWPEANQLAIYKRDRGFELGATQKQIQVVVRAGLKPGTAGLRVRHADHSTTLPPQYRPPAACNVRSRGTSARGRAKGRSNSSGPYNLHERSLTWSRSFVCLAYSNQTHPPRTPSERVVLALNNLGEKRSSSNSERSEVGN